MNTTKQYILFISLMIASAYSQTLFAQTEFQWEWRSSYGGGLLQSATGEASNKAQAVADMQAACDACSYLTDEEFSSVTSTVNFRYNPEGYAEPEFNDWEYSHGLFSFGDGSFGTLTASSLAEVVAYIRSIQPDSDPRCSPTTVSVTSSWNDIHFPITEPGLNQQLCPSAGYVNRPQVQLQCASPGVVVTRHVFNNNTQECIEQERTYTPARRRTFDCDALQFGETLIPVSDGLRTPVCFPLAQGFVNGPRPHADCEGSETTDNPCSPRTGEKLKSVTDYSGSGLTFSRHYKSLQTVNDISIGKAWRHSYDDSLQVGATNDFVYGYVSRSGIYVSLAGSGTVKTPNGRTGNETGIESGTLISDEWNLFFINGDTKVFDLTGRMLRIEKANGQTTTLDYDDSKLVRVTSPYGATLEFAYDGELISEITQPDGAIIRYGYDQRGNLTSVTYPDLTPGDPDDNPTLVYHYEDPRFYFHLTGISDENGVRTQTYSYDENGKAFSSEKASTSSAVGQERVELNYQEVN